MNLRFFKHYKNKPYKYIGVVRHSETLEEMALYESLYENKLGRLWVRPKDMFFENVVIEGRERPRFEKIDFVFGSARVLAPNDVAGVQEVHRACFGEELDVKKLEREGLFLTAYEGGRMVAFKFGFPKQDAFYSWLGGVLPDYRQLGLASELMRRQQSWCLENGFTVITTKTRNKFSPMLKLNLDAGFRIIGTETAPDGEVEILMEKKIKGV